jgi:hypothetical protein
MDSVPSQLNRKNRIAIVPRDRNALQISASGTGRRKCRHHPWMKHVHSERQRNPHLTFKQVLQHAKGTYQRADRSGRGRFEGKLGDGIPRPFSGIPGFEGGPASIPQIDWGTPSGMPDIKSSMPDGYKWADWIKHERQTTGRPPYLR